MGDVVKVEARMGPGSNKPGGVGRVVSMGGGVAKVK